MTDDSDINIQTDPVAAIVCHQCNHTIDVSAVPAMSTVACPECQAEQTVPARLGPFLLLSLLGKGGMGGVFHAYDESLNRFVAIKVLQSSFTEDPDFVASFQREAQAAAGLNHPNVVHIYSFGQEKGQPYIVMELVSGGRLSELIEEKGPLDEKQAMEIARGIASSLDAASIAGLLHGDVKPENILLDEKGTAKLVDFGLAGRAGKQESGGVWGTPNYIAPEKVRRQKVDERSDIYSLGATIYHALAGRPPFVGEDAIAVVKARLEGPPPRLGELRSGLHPDTEAVLGRMMEPEPFRRYPTYPALIADIEKLLPKLQSGDAAKTGAARPGGRVIIKKRIKPAGSESAAAAPAGKDEPAAEQPPPSRQGGKRIILSSSKSAGAQTAATAGAPAADKPEAAAKPRRPRSKTPWIVALAVILLAILSVALVVSSVRRKDNLERFKLKRRIADTHTEIEVLVEKRQDASGRMAQILAQTVETESNAMRLATLLIPEAERARLSDLLIQKQEEPPPGPATAPASTNAAAPGEPASAATNAPPAAAPAPAPVPEAAATNAPAPVAAAGATTNAPAAPPAPPPPPPIPQTDADGLPTLYALVSQPDVARFFTNSLISYGIVETAHGEFDAIQLRLDQARSQALKIEESIRTDQKTENVKHKLDEIDKLKKAVDPDISQLQTTVDAANAGLLRLKDNAGALASANASAQERLAQAKETREREREAQRKAEEERRLREAEARRVFQERLAVRTARDETKPMVAAFRYDEATRALERNLRDITSPVAVVEKQTLLARVKLLNELWQFALDTLKEGVCEWCWEGKADITAADRRGLTVRTKDAPVTWDTVQPAQYGELLKRLMAKKESSLGREQRARLKLAVAVYALETDAAPPDAVASMAEQAAQLWDRQDFRDLATRVSTPLETLTAPDTAK